MSNMPIEMQQCERQDCTIRIGSGFTTDAYYPPMYNKAGENINPDNNVTRGEAHCIHCKKRWDYAEQQGKRTYQLQE